jgi:hypothetical protein
MWLFFYYKIYNLQFPAKDYFCTLICKENKT